MDFCPLFITINTTVCLVLFSLSIILPLLYTLFLAQAQSKMPNMYSIMLKYAFFINIGCTFFFIAISNFMYGSFIAECLDWQPSLFQYEVAWSQIGIAVLGLLCLFLDRHFWLATIIVSTIWLWGAASIHVWQIMTHNVLPYHLAFIVIWELAVPLWIIILYILYTKKRRYYKTYQKSFSSR